MNSRGYDRAIEHWDTIAVEALPAGWRNVYDVEGTLEYSPCPALLVQEHRATVYMRDGLRDTTEPQHTPYPVRVVFADVEEGATLAPAADAVNYVRTVGPG